MTKPFLSEWPIAASLPPDKLVEIQAELAQGWQRVVQMAGQGLLQAPGDRRFHGPAWSGSPDFLLMAHAYVLSARTMYRMVESARVSEKVRKRLRFSVMQWLDAASPSNFLATNPEAQQKLLESSGESLRSGINNLFQDLQKKRMSQSDESRFQVGKNVAVTAGAVVFQNALMQLIQYAPSSTQVHAIPLLIVPPNINKFYILDLQPDNSLVRYAVDQGFTVFLISWRNPIASDVDGVDTATWSDYLEKGVLSAIEAVREISAQEQINALGFCVGGTLLASALALARARGKNPVSALTLLTTLLDFRETGVLDVFVDEIHVQARERELGQGGLMSARELATTFSFLRPNELVWNYVVGNYLKGDTPPALDLLFWNADGTNLPGPFFAWYFRNAYLENNLKTPGHVKIGGDVLDLSTLTMPAYIFASRDDHIVPWASAYASTGLLRGQIRFVLGASGHIAGVINPPSKKRRSYWAHKGAYSSAPSPGEAEAWFKQATEHAGSWWPDWTAWLGSQAGSLRPASPVLGSTRYTPLEAAPGHYVTVRSD